MEKMADGEREWFSILGGIGIFVFTCIALFGPIIAPYPTDATPGQPFEAPSEGHPFGTDDVGHDIFSQLLIGARASLLVGLVTGSMAIMLGIVVGVTAGILGGWTETVLMRFVDIVLTLPFLPLIIVVAAVFGPGLWTTIGILAAMMWARPARELRSEVLSIRQREYITASRAMGASSLYIALRYIVPAVLLIAIAQFAKTVSAAILLEASLSFLGLGDPTMPSWGTILFYAQKRNAFLTDAWMWWVIPPGVAITLSVLSFVFLTLGVERRMGADRQSIATDVPSANIDIIKDDGAHALNITDLTVEYSAYSATAAVDHVAIDLYDDEMLGVVGESGSGKSSFALALLDLLKEPGRVTDGHITLFTDRAYDNVKLEDIRGDEIAYVPQEAMNALDPRIRLDTQLVEAIRTHRDYDRGQAASIAHDTLERVGLPTASHDRYPHELSGGMRQRGVIAMALVNEPAVLVVDEPTTGLDMVTKVNLLELLKELQAERELSVMVISHDLPAVTRVANRIAVMNDGEFVEIGETARLQTDPDHPYTEELLNARTMMPTIEANEPIPDMPAVEDPYLLYEDVYKLYSNEQVLAGVDFQVEREQSVALLGESGAGKSTMGRMALGLVNPDSGTVRIDGKDVHKWRTSNARALGKEVHYVFQDPYSSLAPNRRVEKIVQEPLDIHDEGADLERSNRVQDALEDVGLTPADEYARRYASELSGGERQRVAFARALILKPTLLIADEPTSMLDAPLQRDLLELLYGLVSDRGITLLHITHDVAQASTFADQIAVLHGGQISEQAPVESILRNPKHDQTRTLVDAARTLSNPPDISVRPHDQR